MQTITVSNIFKEQLFKQAKDMKKRGVTVEAFVSSGTAYEGYTIYLESKPETVLFGFELKDENQIVPIYVGTSKL